MRITLDIVVVNLIIVVLTIFLLGRYNKNKISKLKEENAKLNHKIKSLTNEIKINIEINFIIECILNKGLVLVTEDKRLRFSTNYQIFKTKVTVFIPVKGDKGDVVEGKLCYIYKENDIRYYIPQYKFITILKSYHKNNTLDYFKALLKKEAIITDNK